MELSCCLFSCSGLYDFGDLSAIYIPPWSKPSRQQVFAVQCLATTFLTWGNVKERDRTCETVQATVRVRGRTQWSRRATASFQDASCWAWQGEPRSPCVALLDRHKTSRTISIRKKMAKTPRWSTVALPWSTGVAGNKV